MGWKHQGNRALPTSLKQLTSACRASRRSWRTAAACKAVVPIPLQGQEGNLLGASSP